MLTLGACSSFGEASPSTDAGVDAPADSGGAVDSGTDAASARFCSSATNAFFCSDFESGALLAEWVPVTKAPQYFLTLDQAPGQGHVLRAKLDGTSSMSATAETLDKQFTRTSTPVTYALRLRVDQSTVSQSVEIASLRTADENATLAFHIGIAGGAFFFAEFAQGAMAPKDYKESALGAVDTAWHRFEVQVTYEPVLLVEVRMDDQVVVKRPSAVVPTTALVNGLVLSVGVNSIRSVTENLSYAIDDVTLAH
jgi:hypothetical protein